MMKTKVLRALVKLKRYADTPKGELTIVNVLTIITAILMVDISLLIIGMVLS